MQEVLTVPESQVAAFYRASAFYTGHDAIEVVRVAIRESGCFLPRAEAERDASYKQIIPCAVLTHADHVFYIRRTANANRRALRLKYTVVLGGHVEQEDVDGDTALETCLRRELREEIGLEIEEAPAPVGIVADPLTRSGELHLGIVYRIDVSTPSIRLSKDCDTSEFVRAKQSRLLEAVPLVALKRKMDKFDPWSRLVLGGLSVEDVPEQSGNREADWQFVLPLQGRAV